MRCYRQIVLVCAASPTVESYCDVSVKINLLINGILFYMLEKSLCRRLSLFWWSETKNTNEIVFVFFVSDTRTGSIFGTGFFQGSGQGHPDVTSDKTINSK